MINALHVTTLGIGFGAASMAFVGLVDYASNNDVRSGVTLSGVFSSVEEKPKITKRRSEEFAMIVLM